MKLSILVATLACFTPILSPGAEPLPDKAAKPQEAGSYPAGIVFEFALLEGERTVATATLHADADYAKAAKGRVLLRHANGDRWRIDGSVSHFRDPAKGDAAPLEGTLRVEIGDLRLTHVPQGESNSIFTPTIYEIYRTYRGPGTYQLFEEGDRRMTVTVKDRVLEGEKKADSRPASLKR